ncbi:MAG: histidine kinase [Thermoanaerobaculia bacterium]
MFSAREIGSRFQSRSSVQPDDLGGALKRALEEVCAIFDSKFALLTWEESEEPWVVIARCTSDEFHCREEKVEPFAPPVAPELSGSTFWVSSPRAGSMVRADGESSAKGAVITEALLGELPSDAMLTFPIIAARGEGRVFVSFAEREHLELALLAADAAGRLVGEQLDRHLHVAASTDEAVARERVRVARDLHDGLLQSFTGIVLQLETAHSVLTTEPERAKRMVTEAEASLMADQRELRSFVEQLGPRAARAESAFDFNARLQDLVSRLHQQWSIHLLLDLSGVDVSVSRHLGHETYRILHEAVMNAAKHGAAKNINVRMRTGEGRIRIEVSDDGSGFEWRGRMLLEAIRESGRGPRMLAERVIALNGDLAIESSDSGARVEITVPLGFVEDF